MAIKKFLPISPSTWAEIGLLALASLFGMQALRALPRVIFFIFRFLPGVSHLDNDFVSLPTQVSTIIVGLCALTAIRQPSRDRNKGPLTVKAALAVPPWERFRTLWLVIWLLFLAPVILLWQPPQAISPIGFPVRVMTYNLHTGLNSLGQLSLAEQAPVIEESQADIVALQEVSRGSYLSGSFDTLTWLSQRLEMPYICQTEKPTHPLPPLKRGILHSPLERG